MQIIKYSTEHLVCHQIKDENNKRQYVIFEKEDTLNPVCLYIDKTTMKLDSDRVPEGKEETYKYFFELGEIVQFLYDME